MRDEEREQGERDNELEFQVQETPGDIVQREESDVVCGRVAIMGYTRI